MSTLRISNIEAKSVPASATIDEKVKITNSSGDTLVFLDGKTSGITTVGINTTDGNITFDANSNVVVTGIITATRFSGQITPTSLEIGSNIKLGNAGVITATSFVGSGANLTSLPAQATIANNADNRVITGGSGVNLNGESNLRFDGTNLSVGNNSSFSPHAAADNLVVGDSSGSNGMTILTNASTGNIFFNDGSGNDGVIQYVHSSSPNYMRISSSGHIEFDCNGTERLRIDASGNLFLRSASANYLVMGSSGDATSGGVTNNMNWIRGNGTNTQYNTAGGFHAFEVSGSEKFRINNTGHVTINDGDLVIGTSGHGIDFSTTSDGSSVSNKSEILDDYEEGSFTPTMSVEGQGSNASLALAIGTYTKVGAMVNIWIEAQFNGTPSGRSTSNAWQFGGLPFSSQAYTVAPSGLRDYRFPMIAMALDTSSTYGSNGHFLFRLFDNQTAGRIEWQHSDLELKNASLFIQNGTMIQIHACYPDF